MASTTKLPGLRILAICLGLVYLIFGLLKFFPGASPAEGLAKDTIRALSMGQLTDQLSIVLLAIWETGLAILLLSGRFLKITVILGIIHMCLTFTPLYLFPDLCFTDFPKLTLLGQYILKNIVFVIAFGLIYPKK